jgi:hypothetical protein
MATTQRDCPGRESEAITRVSAGDLNTAIIRRAVRFDSRRTLARRRIVRELDEWFGVFAYPDPMTTYAVAPSREALDD